MTAVVDWAIAGSALAREPTSGDLGLVVPFPNGALVAVIDGLGHGPDAAAAARAAADVLEAQPDIAVDQLVAQCHESLRRTRGAVMSLASIDAVTSSMTWLGVGNVEGVVVRAPNIAPAQDATLACRGGAVGYMLPPLNPRIVMLRPHDIVVFATDGIRTGFRQVIAIDRRPQQIADAIHARYAKGTDDACVLVARFIGEPASATLAIAREHDVAAARKWTRDIARRLGFSDPALEALATAVSEIARNIVDHAAVGALVIRPIDDGVRRGIEIEARDHGPGIADVELALRDGYSSNGGLGLGLSSARRFVDELDVCSTPGEGTTVTLRKWLA